MPVSIRGKTWYVYLVPKNSDVPQFEGKIVLKGVERPVKAVLLATGKEIPVTVNEETFSIDVPSDIRTDSLDVVAVEWK